MTATEYTGQEINMNFFPSVRSYNKNKTSLSESEINFVPAHTVIEVYQDNNTWYRKYSDGWIEQGGLYTSTASGLLITFSIPFSNVNYNIIATCNDYDNSLHGIASIGSKTATGCKLSVINTESNSREYLTSVFACGY